MDIRHLCFREKDDIDFIKAAGAACHRCNIELLRFLMHIPRQPLRLACGFIALDFIQKLIQPFDKFLRISVCTQTAFYLFHFPTDEIFYFQYMLHQFQVGNVLGMGFP